MVKFFLKTFFLIVSISIFNIAYAAEGDMCGLKPISDISEEEIISKGLQNSQYMPNENSYEICEEDVAYKIYYLIFHEAIETPVVSSIFDAFTSIDDGFKDKAKLMDLSGPVMMVLYAFSIIVFVFVLISFSISAIYTIYRGSAHGEFLGRRFSGFKAFSGLFIAIIVVFPVGSFTIGQLTILLAGLIAISLGNLLFSVFLYSTGIKSSEINISDQSIAATAEAFSMSLVKTQLVADRTKRAVASANLSDYDGRTFFESVKGVVQANIIGKLNVGIGALNFMSGSEKMESIDYPNEDSNFNFGNINVNNCIGSYFLPEYSSSKNNNLSKKEIYKYRIKSYEDCYTGSSSASDIGDERNFFLGALSHDEDRHGYPYNSGVITYGESALFGTDYEAALASGTRDDVDDTMKDIVLDAVKRDLPNVVNSFAGAGKAQELLSGFQQLATSNSGNLLEAANSDFVPSLQDEISSSIRESFKNFKNSSDFSAMEAPKAQGMYLYLMHHFALKSLLGGFSEGIFFLDRPSSEGISNTLKTMTLDYALPAAKHIETAVCYQNLSSLVDSRALAKKVNNGEFENTEDGWEDFVEEAGNSKALFQCANTELLSGDTPSFRFIGTEIGSSDIFATNEIFDSETNALLPGYSTVGAQAARELLTVAKAKYETPITLYIYTAKKATLESMSQMLKEETDKTVINTVRKKGWLAFGSYLLDISQLQSGSYNYINELRNFLEISESENNTEAGGTYAVNFNAFFDSKESLEEVASLGISNLLDHTNTDGLKPVNLNSYWLSSSSQSNSMSNKPLNMGDQDNFDQAFEALKNGVKELLLAPSDPLRQMVGAEYGQSFGEKLEDCANGEQDCIPQVHPLNAVTAFGHELLTLGLTFLVVGLVTEALMESVDVAIDAGLGKIFGNKMPGFMKKVIAGFTGGLIKVVLYAIYLIGQLISTAAYPLMFAGIFLGYVVPLIPFVAYIVAFMGWIVSIFIGLLVILIWPALWAFPKEENESSRINFKALWGLYGQIIAKPAILVLALSFAWVLASIIVFAISMLISIVFSSVEASSYGFANYLFDFILFYLTISVLIFIALTYSFRVVNKLTDEFFKKTGMDPSSDQQMMDSLAFERLLQTKIAADTIYSGIQTPGSMMNDKIKQARDKRVLNKLMRKYNNSKKDEK